jgi:hypothetical protein
VKQARTARRPWRRRALSRERPRLPPMPQRAAAGCAILHHLAPCRRLIARNRAQSSQMRRFPQHLGSAAARRKGSTPFPCTKPKVQDNPSTSGSLPAKVGGHSGAIGAGSSGTRAPSDGEGQETAPDVRRFRRVLVEVVRLLDEGDLVTARALLVGLLATVTSRSR